MNRTVKIIAIVGASCLLAFEPIVIAQKGRGPRSRGGGLRERFNAAALGGGRLRERFNNAARNNKRLHEGSNSTAVNRNKSKESAVSRDGGRRENFNKIGKETSRQNGNGKKSSSGGDKSGTTGRSSTPRKPTFETPTNKKRPKNSGPKP